MRNNFFENVFVLFIFCNSSTFDGNGKGHTPLPPIISKSVARLSNTFSFRNELCAQFGDCLPVLQCRIRCARYRMFSAKITENVCRVANNSRSWGQSGHATIPMQCSTNAPLICLSVTNIETRPARGQAFYSCIDIRSSVFPLNSPTHMGRGPGVA